MVVLTDRFQCSRPLIDVVATAVDGGARAVILREKDLPHDERAALARELRTVLDPVGGVLVHGGAAGSAGSTAVHLSAADPFPTSRPMLVGRSCHSAGELSRAKSEHCDYVLLSPVFPSPSKPGYGPALGVDGFARLLPAGLPTYALGGVRPEDVPELCAVGAQGVAVMGAVMRDPRSVRDYLAALPEVPG